MPIEPTLAEVIETAIDSRLLDLHTMMIGRVMSYDAPTQTAVIQPVVNGAAPNVDGTTTSETLPNIPNVPVRWERAGGYYDHKPLTAGIPNPANPGTFLVPPDHGMLIFSESAFASWRTNGEISDPGDLTRHGMSYAYFVPGAWPDANALPDHPTDHAVSIVQNFLRVSKANSTTAALVALATLVDQNFQTLMTKFNMHTHSVVTTGSATTQTGTAAATTNTLSAFPSTACTSLKAD